MCQYSSDFHDPYLFLIGRTYVTRKQVVHIDISKSCFMHHPSRGASNFNFPGETTSRFIEVKNWLVVLMEVADDQKLKHLR